MVVVDNNILSSLAKVDRLELLKKFFDEVKTTPEVVEEFRNEKIEGYKFVERIDEVKTFEKATEEKWLSVSSLTDEENKEKERTLNADRSIGVADAECFVAAKKENEILLTDDRYLGEKAMSEGIEACDLETFLEACVGEEIINDSSDLRNMLKQLEERDYYSFSAGFKDKLFSMLEEGS